MPSWSIKTKIVFEINHAQIKFLTAISKRDGVCQRGRRKGVASSGPPWK